MKMNRRLIALWALAAPVLGCDSGSDPVTLADLASEEELFALALAAENAINEVASDEDVLGMLEEGISRRSLSAGAPACRTVSPSSQGLDLDYGACAGVSGHVVVGRDGPVGSKYFVVDFQDGFRFHGVGVTGQVELTRRTEAGAFDLRIRREHGKQIVLDRRRSDRHVKAVLFLAGALYVRSDHYELRIDQTDASGVSGDPSWGPEISQLRDRELGLYTHASEDGALALPRPAAACLCPSAGRLHVAGSFADIPIVLADEVGPIGEAVARLTADSRVIQAFQQFQMPLRAAVVGDVESRFGAACGEPVLDVRSLTAPRVPIAADNTTCPAATASATVVGRVAEILSGISGVQNRSAIEAGIRRFLTDHADSSGCFSADVPRTRAALLAELALDPSACAASP